MEEAASDSSSDSGGDEDDEDFNPVEYDERSDFRYAKHYIFISLFYFTLFYVSFRVR